MKKFKRKIKNDLKSRIEDIKKYINEVGLDAFLAEFVKSDGEYFTKDSILQYREILIRETPVRYSLDIENCQIYYTDELVKEIEDSLIKAVSL